MIKSEISKKPRYNLNIILQETGIKADTLRAWEKRYQLPQPSRTNGGHRLFSEYDLEIVRWLLCRQQEGMRISQAVNFWRELLDANQDPLASFAPLGVILDQYQTLENGGQTLERLQASWLAYGLEYNEAIVEQILSQAFAQFPLETVCTELIIPGMAELGERWFKGLITVHQEHYISELASRKLQTLISTAPQPIHSQRILIGCPPGEFHTIPGLILNLLLRFRGWDVIYLGANLPIAQLADTVAATKPDLILLTASRLESSAALFTVANFLQDQQIPLAFGGWIFNQMPEIAQHIPGKHLLSDLNGAVPIIEELILNQAPRIPTPADPTKYRELISNFQNKIPVLKNLIIKRFLSELDGISPSIDPREEIGFLLNNILSALTLGDIEYLGPDFLWIGELLNNQNLQSDLFPKFINIVIGAIQENLDESASPILEWMTHQLNKFH